MDDLTRTAFEEDAAKVKEQLAALKQSRRYVRANKKSTTKQDPQRLIGYSPSCGYWSDDWSRFDGVHCPKCNALLCADTASHYRPATQPEICERRLEKAAKALIGEWQTDVIKNALRQLIIEERNDTQQT